MKELVKELLANPNEVRHYTDTSAGDVTVASQGGATVEKELAGVFESIYAPSKLFKETGIDIITGLEGDSTVPIFSADLMADSVAEKVESPIKPIQFQSKTLKPKRVTITLELSKKFLTQTGYMEYLKREVVKGIWNKIEMEATLQTGSIFSGNLLGDTLNPVSMTEDVISIYESQINGAGGDGNYAMVVGSTTLSQMKGGLDKASFSYQPHLHFEDKSVTYSKHMGDNHMSYFQPSAVKLGLWNNIELSIVESYDLARQGKVGLVVSVYADMNKTKQLVQPLTLA